MVHSDLYIVFHRPTLVFCTAIPTLGIYSQRAKLFWETSIGRCRPMHGNEVWIRHYHDESKATIAHPPNVTKCQNGRHAQSIIQWPKEYRFPLSNSLPKTFWFHPLYLTELQICMYTLKFSGLLKNCNFPVLFSVADIRHPGENWNSEKCWLIWFGDSEHHEISTQNVVSIVV